MDKTNTRTYEYHQDCRHGWIGVPKKDLVELGIADKISPFSYMNGDMAYLEEDCDAGILLDVLKKRGIEFTCNGFGYDEDEEPSIVRTYDSYEYRG